MNLPTALALAAVLVLAVLLRRSRRRVRTLEDAVARRREDIEHLERSFARFAPAAVVERFAAGATELKPERRDVTILFADLVGFTPLSEVLDPGVMVPLLNGYFRAMSSAIGAHHGHVSRIMGDGLLALFGAIGNNPWHATDAVRAALAMREALAAYNVDLRARALPELRFGVGIHRGEAVAGVVGSDDLAEFTVIGDPVNVAARIEQLTRTHGVDILVTADVRRDLDERFRVRPMPAAVVKGKSQPLETFAVEAFDGTAGPSA